MMTVTKCCCSCGAVLLMEQMIIDRLGGDSSTSIDFCLECQCKAFNDVLNDCVLKFQDIEVRKALRSRLYNIAAAEEEGSEE